MPTGVAGGKRKHRWTSLEQEDKSARRSPEEEGFQYCGVVSGNRYVADRGFIRAADSEALPR